MAIAFPPEIVTSGKSQHWWIRFLSEWNSCFLVEDSFDGIEKLLSVIIDDNSFLSAHFLFGRLHLSFRRLLPLLFLLGITFLISNERWIWVFEDLRLALANKIVYFFRLCFQGLKRLSLKSRVCLEPYMVQFNSF